MPTPPAKDEAELALGLMAAELAVREEAALLAGPAVWRAELKDWNGENPVLRITMTRLLNTLSSNSQQERGLGEGNGMGE